MTPRDPARLHTEDLRLKEQMRHALARSPASGTEALQDRALAQWRLRASGQPVAHGGAIGVLPDSWRPHARVWLATALLACGLLALALLRPWVTADPALEELMQPDLLSLIAIGEL